jgi:hypothetical protein
MISLVEEIRFSDKKTRNACKRLVEMPLRMGPLINLRMVSGCNENINRG